MPRHKFALVFSPNPPAADVVGEPLIVEGLFEVGAEVKFRWKKQGDGKKNPIVYETIEGRIVCTGKNIFWILHS